MSEYSSSELVMLHTKEKSQICLKTDRLGAFLVFASRTFEHGLCTQAPNGRAVFHYFELPNPTSKIK